MVPHTKDRPAYQENGKPDKNPETGIIDRFVTNSPRLFFPQREDFKLIIRSAILKSLQVPRRCEQPYKFIRYPKSEGSLKADLLEARINWLMNNLKQSKFDAKLTATEELANFYSSEALDEQDPLGSLTQVSH